MRTPSSSKWGTAEYLGPHSAVVHRVNDRAAWRRVWALTSHWTHELHRLGRPECFFPQAIMPRGRGKELRELNSSARSANLNVN